MLQPNVVVAAPVEWRSPVRTLARLAGPTIQRLTSASLPSTVDTAVAEQVRLGVTRKLSLMPVHVSMVVLTLTCVFGLVASLRSGRSIDRVPDDIVRRHVERWSNSSLALMRDTILLYGRLVRFQYHSRETSGDDGANA